MLHLLSILLSSRYFWLWLPSDSLCSLMTGIKRHLPGWHLDHLTNCNQRWTSWSGNLSCLVIWGWIIHNFRPLLFSGKIKWLLLRTHKEPDSHAAVGREQINKGHLCSQPAPVYPELPARAEAVRWMFCGPRAVSFVWTRRIRVLPRRKGF